MKAIILIAVACSLVPRDPAVGQGLPGTNLSVTVRASAVVSGATTTVSYSITNASTSRERLQQFLVNIRGTGTSVTSPTPASRWMTWTSYRGHNVAGWTAIRGVAPGDSTPTLTFQATGVPGIGTAWFSGDSGVYADPADTVAAPFYDELNDLSVKTFTIGVDVAPTTSTALAARLQTQSDSACALGWITSSSLCSTLHTNSANDSYATINQFGVSLDSARSAGSAVSDAAYWLLKPNATYVLAHTTPPALSADITGDTATSIYTAHPSGGVPAYSYMIPTLDSLAAKFHAVYSANLQVNDMSLRYGGKFDLDTLWGDTAHVEHRLGRSADISSLTAAQYANVVFWWKNAGFGLYFHPEAGKAHLRDWRNP